MKRSLAIDVPTEERPKPLRGSVPDDTVMAFAREFRTSMPASYRKNYDWRAIREHAEIVRSRDGALSRLEPWRARRGLVIVMVTDDRPGTLAMMSAAIAASGLDILAAEAYCRTRRGALPEAVALFELCHATGPDGPAIGEDEVARVRGTFDALLRGETDTETVIRRDAKTYRPPAELASPEVTFADEGPDRSTLLVEARDRPGLLATITAALSAQGARIVHSDIVTVGGRARDQFHLMATDGTPLGTARKAAIAAAVLHAIDVEND